MILILNWSAFSIHLQVFLPICFGASWLMESCFLNSMLISLNHPVQCSHSTNEKTDSNGFSQCPWYYFSSDILSNSFFPNYKDFLPLSGKDIAQYSSKNSPDSYHLSWWYMEGGRGLLVLCFWIFVSHLILTPLFPQGATCFYRPKILSIGNFIRFHLITKSETQSLFLGCYSHWASLVAQMIKSLPAMRETRVRYLGWEDPLEKEMATHSSTLAWKIPWTEEPGRLQSMGSQRVGHDRATSLNSHWYYAFYFLCLCFLGIQYTLNIIKSKDLLCKTCTYLS